MVTWRPKMSRNQMQYGTDRLRPMSRANRTVQIIDVTGEDWAYIHDRDRVLFFPSQQVSTGYGNHLVSSSFPQKQSGWSVMLTAVFHLE
jgi:hypothetical protein